MNTAMRRDGFEYMDLDDFEELLADKPRHEKWELLAARRPHDGRREVGALTHRSKHHLTF